MFFKRPALTARPATLADTDSLLALTRFEDHVHVHLDWKGAETWLGFRPFWVAERGKRLVGVLACPPAPPDTAWLRVFAVQGNIAPKEIWDLLWPLARQELETLGCGQIAALSLESWTEPLYRSAGLAQTHSVMVLTRPASLAAGPVTSPARIRPARPEDHAAIIATDSAAFAPPWQISADIAQHAISQALHLTVAEIEEQVVGYQLTTTTGDGAHLARLAVLPRWQGRQIGAALVAEMLEACTREGARTFSVNTQDNNAASLAVYQRLGFTLNGIHYPAYQLALK